MYSLRPKENDSRELLLTQRRISFKFKGRDVPPYSRLVNGVNISPVLNPKIFYTSGFILPFRLGIKSRVFLKGFTGFEPYETERKTCSTNILLKLPPILYSTL